MPDDEPQEAMLLTTSEWNDLADICDYFKRWAEREGFAAEPYLQTKIALCQRVIDAV